MKVESVSKTNTQIRISKVADQAAKAETQQRDVNPQQSSSAKATLDQQDLELKLQELEDKLEFLNRRFDYQVHEETGKLVVAIVDKQTEEIVRTVPPEYLLDIAAKLREFVGLIVDERY